MSLPPLANPRLVAIASALLLSAAECREILDRVDPTGWVPSLVEARNDAGRAGRELRPHARSVKEQPIICRTDGWPLWSIVNAATRANSESTRFELHGLVANDPPMLLRYEAESGDHFNVHVDLGTLISTRKLSFSIQLSDPEDYEGGDLQFPATGHTADRSRGSVCLFPSFLPHQVTTVTKGVRHAIVGWLHGPAFR